MTTLTKYAGANWVQSQLDAWHNNNPKKYKKIEMSELGRRAADLLGDWVFGIYHLNHKSILKADWTNPIWIEISIWNAGLSTYDFDDLTRLVFLAHDHAIRVHIEPSTHHHLRMLFHPRTNTKTNGESHKWHPTLEEAVNLFRQTHPKEDTP